MNTARRNPIARYVLYALVGIVVAALIVLRLYLGAWLLQYVNREVNSVPGYQGSVQGITIDLYRGAYRIHGLKVDKKNGHIPTPFISISQADLAIQWGALFHGRIVSNIDLWQPVINFAVNNDAKQTGADADWTKPIKKLSPIDINHITFREGKLTYQDFSSHPQVNIYIHHMQGEVTNLRNVVNVSKPLPSTLYVKGDSIGRGALEIRGRMNILRRIPDMHIDAQLVNVNLRALSDYTNAYAAVDVKSGNLSVYSELLVNNGRVSGYVKPIAADISLIDLRKDDNPLKVTWEAMVTIVLRIFTNLPKDQFATRIPLEGNIDHISTDTWSAIGGILHNAFIHALQKGFDESGKASPLPAGKP